MKYGYARVSKSDQILDRQVNALKEYGCDEIITESISTRSKQIKLQELIEKMKDGDTLVVVALNRLGRDTRKLIDMFDEFTKKNINFVSLKETFDTSTAVGRATMLFLSVIAQTERDVLSERTLDGLEAARRRGSKSGRPPLSPQKKEQMVKLYLSDKYTVREICELLGVSRSTVLHLGLNIIRTIQNKSETQPIEAICKEYNFSIETVKDIIAAATNKDEG